LTHPLSSDGFRNPGEVRRGQHLGYLEIDSILTAIVSPADGAALTLCSTEGALVSFGQAVAEVHDIRPT
jgi:biotin carboxyl carrier protein